MKERAKVRNIKIETININFNYKYGINIRNERIGYMSTD